LCDQGHFVLFGVHGNFTALHFHYRAFLADFKLNAAIGGGVHLNVRQQLHCREARASTRTEYLPGTNAPEEYVPALLVVA